MSFWLFPNFFVFLSPDYPEPFFLSFFNYIFIMKKALFSLLLSLFVSVVAQAQIVITEIMYNPPESGTDSLEFVEVLNTSAVSVDMTDWKLEFGTSSFTIPSLTVGAGQYQVFSVNSGAMQRNFGVASIQWTSGGMSNNGTSVRVKNASAVLVDSLTYDDIAPWPTSPDGLGNSLVLCDPNADNTLASSWVECPTETQVVIAGVTVYANPGAASGCVSGLVTENDVVNLLPGQSSIFTVLLNDNIPSPITAFTITSGPSHGTAVIQQDNSILYTPTAGYCGSDALTYQVCDGPNSCGTAAVSITIKCYPERAISDVNNVNIIGQADSVNVNCQLVGIVHGVNLRASSSGLQFIMMNHDGTEGIAVFRNTGTFGYSVQEGDEVVARGTIAQFSGLTQLNLDTIYKISGSNPLATPAVVLRVDESTENRLVRIKNLRFVDASQWIPGIGSGFTVQVYSPSNINDTIALRVDNDVDLFNQTLPPTEPFDAIGLGGQFDATAPFTSGYQLTPRYTFDILTNVSTSLVNFSSFVKIAPNPVKDVMNIQTSTTFERITVFATNGSVLKVINNPAAIERVGMIDMPAGVYAVRFEKDGSVWTTGVIKQ